MTTETTIQNSIRLALGQYPDLVLWRNNTGVAETYDHTRGGARFVRYGLGVGSADLVGVLGPLGRFVALEIKTATGRSSKEQIQWAVLVRSRGGFAAVVRSPEEAVAAIDRARKGEDR